MQVAVLTTAQPQDIASISAVGTGDIVDILTSLDPDADGINRWYWNNTGWPMRGGWALRVIDEVLGDIEDATKDSFGNYKLKPGTYVFSTHLYIPEDVI